MDKSPAAHTILATMAAYGPEDVKHLVGGCVPRDRLLGAPKDFDVATDALPDQVPDFASIVSAAFGACERREGVR